MYIPDFIDYFDPFSCMSDIDFKIMKIFIMIISILNTDSVFIFCVPYYLTIQCNEDYQNHFSYDFIHLILSNPILNINLN